MDEGAEALTCCGIPDTANEIVSHNVFVMEGKYTEKRANGLDRAFDRGKRKLEFWEDISKTHIRPSPAQLTNKVPSWMKSTPPTGSECAGTERMTRAVRTSQRNTASSYEPLMSIFPFGENAREYM